MILKEAIQIDIPVVFATDDNYVQYLSIAIQSILENSRSNISIYILHLGLKEENVRFLEQQIESFDNINIYFINCSLEVSILDLDPGGVKHLNSLAWLRLLIPYLLSQYHKVIYFDVDILVLKDIEGLFQIDIGNNLIAAARDTFIVSWDNQDCVKDQLSKPKNYF